MSKYDVNAIPPKGHILAYVVDAESGTSELQWVDPQQIDHEESVRVFGRRELTQEQRDRIKRVQWTLKEHDRMGLERWYYNFSCDMHPDREIFIWEAVAQTYQEELALRPACGPRVRALLYAALVQSAMVQTVDQLLAVEPRLKGLTSLSRVLEGFRAKLRRGTLPDAPHRQGT